MCFRRSKRSVSILGLQILIALGFRAALVAEPATIAIRIDRVADRYALQEFSFEVNAETGRAGIRLEYYYPPGRVGGDDSDRGPAPKIATLPGLIYDAAAHAVVYNDGPNRATCATAANHRTLFWKNAYMKPTGACIVSSRLTQHSRDNGWSIDRSRTLDTYFEVQRK